MKKIQVKNLIFNHGTPKICIPLSGTNEFQILNEVKNISNLEFDLVELRIDFFEYADDFSKVKCLLEKIREIYFKPLLFTFRTTKDGGAMEISEENYFKLNYSAIESGLIDIVDIELSTTELVIKKLISFAKQKKIKVIMSSHDFHKTPAKEEILNNLYKMQEYGADITKIAVMPNSEEDVLTLLKATLEMKKSPENQPCILISMGKLGVITRLTGELFGSCMTFATAVNSSAPGQITATKTREILDLFHKN